MDRGVARVLLLREDSSGFLKVELQATYPHRPSAVLPCSWGTGWGENGFLRMKKEPWLDGPNAPSGVYWRGIYSASRPIVGQGEWMLGAAGDGCNVVHLRLHVASCCFLFIG